MKRYGRFTKLRAALADAVNTSKQGSKARSAPTTGSSGRGKKKHAFCGATCSTTVTGDVVRKRDPVDIVRGLLSSLAAVLRARQGLAELSRAGGGLAAADSLSIFILRDESLGENLKDQFQEVLGELKAVLRTLKVATTNKDLLREGDGGHLLQLSVSTDSDFDTVTGGPDIYEKLGQARAILDAVANFLEGSVPELENERLISSRDWFSAAGLCRDLLEVLARRVLVVMEWAEKSHRRRFQKGGGWEDLLRGGASSTEGPPDRDLYRGLYGDLMCLVSKTRALLTSSSSSRDRYQGVVVDLRDADRFQEDGVSF